MLTQISTLLLLRSTSPAHKEPASTSQAMTWASRMPPKSRMLSPRNASRKIRAPAVRAANHRKSDPANVPGLRNQINPNIKNEKINSISVNASSPWVTIAAQYSTFNDHLYFADSSSAKQIALQQQIIAPSQYVNTINYLSVKASKEFKFWKLALDNTLLYQKVDQSDMILNVPEFVTRNTFYYSQNLFHKALFFQTGVTLNYFTNYFGNEYNPVIGEFFVQNQKKIGNYANLDFFFNAQIQRTRVYLTLEHFNSSLSGYNFLSSPNNPSGDFIIRFGLVWNFFQ